MKARLWSLYDTPGAAENWWVYLTLFSTLIPSAFNLLIGMISLVTVSSQSGRHDLIRRIRRLPDKGRATTRFEISLRLALPVFVGTTLSGLMIWGAVDVLAWFGAQTLQFFLLIAVWFASVVMPA